MGCLSEDTMLALMDGTLTPPDRDVVDLHLRDCGACLRLVAVTADPSGARVRPLRAAEQRIGRFDVLEPIGAGGIGIVYSAWDPELSRSVALKLMRPEVEALGEGRDRVLREAQAMARLKHPNVVGIYEVGTWQGRVFIAMEMVGGRTLREWLVEQERSWREVVQVFIGAARGLAAAHAAGLVHRDFKPENVLVGDDGRVLVTDFGLARLAEQLQPSVIVTAGALLISPADTPLGTLVGTPAYMAPEQMAGAPADARSDLFAFCTALYEAAAGTRPYPGADFAALRERASSGVLEPARRPLPRWLRRLLRRGLRPDPAQRPQSIEALIAALERGLAPRRGRWVAAAAALLAFVAALAVGLGLRRAPGPRRTVALVELRDPGHSDANVGFLAPALGLVLATELGSSPELSLLPPSAVTPALKATGGADAPLSADAADRLLKALAADAVVSGAFEIEDHRLRVHLDVFAAGGKLLGRVEETGASDLLVPLAARLGPPLRRALSASAPADLAKLEGSFPESERAAQLYVRALTGRGDSFVARVQLLRDAEQLSPGNPRILAVLTEWLAALGAEQEAREMAGRARLRQDELPPNERGRFEIVRLRAVRQFDEAVVAARHYWADDPASVERGFMLVKEQGFAGKYVDALVTLEQLRKLPGAARSQWRIDLEEAMISVDVGDLRRARAAAARVAARRDELPDKRALATARRVEGEALQALGEDLPLARRLLEEAEALFLDSGDLSGAAFAQRALSSLLSASGDHAGARARIEAALATWHKLGNRPQEADALITLATILRNLRDLPEAVRRAAQGKVIFEELGFKREVVSAVVVLGNLYDDAGDMGGATEALEQAVAAARVDRSAVLRDALLGLARLRREQDDLPAARKLLDEARGVTERGGSAAESTLQLAGAELSFAEGRFASAAAAAAEAARLALLAGELAAAGGAEALRARALLALDEPDHAKSAIAHARELMARAHGGLARAPVEVAGALLLALEGPAQLAAARASLRKVADEATRAGVALDRWEALLALAGLEPRASRAGQLRALSRQARAQGFRLYARHADAAARAR